MSTAMAMKVTPLKDVKPYKSGWKVHVKVLHSWKQYNPVHGDTLEMVLSDEAGCKIHASCKRTYMESKGRLLPVGAWRHIQNFTLSPSTGMYRATDHPLSCGVLLFGRIYEGDSIVPMSKSSTDW